MANRIEELMSMRALNQSGVDSQAVIRALAANPQTVATPTTYAYGMNVQDAQREAQLGTQAQQERMKSIQDSRDAAMRQDAMRYDMAMKAHQQYMAERNQRVSEMVAASEMRYRQALMDKNQVEIENSRLANEKLQLDIEREKALDDLSLDVPDPANPGKTLKMPVRAFMGAGGKNILSYMTGKTGNETGTERTITNRAKIYASKGINEDDAYLLAASKPESTFQQISKAIDLKIKNSKNSLTGKLDFGTKGTDASGKAIPKTEDDVRSELYGQYIDQYFPMLSQDTRNKLKEWGFGALGTLNYDTPPEDPLANIDIDALQQALIDAYR